MKIGELANATGTKVETIRYHEQTGLLLAPTPTRSNYRGSTIAECRIIEVLGPSEPT